MVLVLCCLVLVLALRVLVLLTSLNSRPAANYYLATGRLTGISNYTTVHYAAILSALIDDWTHGAANRHITAPASQPH